MPRERPAADPVAAWEYLLWDPGPPGSAARPPRRARLLAAARTVRAARLLRRHGWPVAQRHLRAQRPVVRVDAPPAPSEAVRAARREVLPCLHALRLADPDALCLARSYALVTYLTALGLPAEVVVARQRSSIGGRFAFHAWAELYEEVLGDIPGVRTGYTVLQRVGCEQVQKADADGPGRAGARDHPEVPENRGPAEDLVSAEDETRPGGHGSAENHERHGRPTDGTTHRPPGSAA